MKTLSDLSDLEYEALADKMYDSPECQSAFIEVNYQDFEEYMNDRGIYHDDYCDHEIDYCEARDEDFIKFAFEYFNKIPDAPKIPFSEELNMRLNKIYGGDK